VSKRLKTTVPPAIQAVPSESWFPFAILFALLVIVAVRLSISEIAAQEFISFMQDLMPAKDSPPLPPEPGPATIAGLSVLTLLLAGMAAWCSRITRVAWIVLALIVAIGTFAVASTFHAANKFNALVGTFDLAMGLVAGWAVMLLATTERRRRLVVAVFAAVLAAWVAKGLYQRAFDIPETMQYYNEHKEEIWREHGWQPGDFHIKLFEGRMNSKEVSGFAPFSNVFAEGLIALSLLALGLTAVNAAVKARWDSKEVAPTIVYGVFAGLMFFLAWVVLILTQSKGACAAAAILGILVLAGLHFRTALQSRWKLVCMVVLTTWAAGTAGVIGYGIRHDALPSRSLLFRWHYWTASVPIIRTSPVLGIGLNNFGSYYLTYKRPSSPEDVKDPHSFFVRFAAEAGVPAAALVAVLLVVWFYGAARALVPPANTGVETSGPRADIPRTPFALAIAFVGVWWIARVVLNERLDINLVFDFLFAACSFGGFLLADATCRTVAGATRAARFAILAGALGMLLYDQINVGLVTGPLAMFFWMCLGMAAGEPAAPAPLKPLRYIPWAAKVTGAVLCVTSLTLALAVLAPIAQDAHPWDPRVPERQLVAQILLQRPFDDLPYLDAAIACDPLSTELLHRRILAKAARHLPVADDIRSILALDRCDVHLRIELARIQSDWPAAERVAALQEALSLNDQLEKGEAKRLDDAQVQTVKAQIAALKRELVK
jgi:hypothetical protein